MMVSPQKIHITIKKSILGYVSVVKIKDVKIRIIGVRLRQLVNMVENVFAAMRAI